jgi:acyl-CoA thioesterase
MFSLVDIAMGLACSSTHGFRPAERDHRVQDQLHPRRRRRRGAVHRPRDAPGRRTLVVEADVTRATNWSQKRKAPSLS